MVKQTPIRVAQTTTTLDTQADTEPEMDPKKARGARLVKILRVTQSSLAAVLSLAIAAFQLRVYVTYQNTRQQGDTWPNVPNVMPTILLFTVALVALIFDGCSKFSSSLPAAFYPRAGSAGCR